MFISPVENEGEEEDAPDLNVLQPIYDWVKPVLSSDGFFVRGLGLNVLADLVVKNKACAEDLIESGLATAQLLVDNSSDGRGQMWNLSDSVLCS
jgi:hypothetical protein